MGKLIYQHRVYFISLSLLLAIGFILMAIAGINGASGSLINQHPFWLNVFFINYTFIGNGLFVLALIGFIFFYLKRKQEAIILFCAFLFSAIVIQLIRNLAGNSAPDLFIEPGQDLFFIEGGGQPGYIGLPSGHTSNAFSIATALLLTLKDKRRQILLLAMALLVGFSRIYLSGHLPIDIITGAIIGTAGAVIAVYLVKNSKRMKSAFYKMHSLRKRSKRTSKEMRGIMNYEL